MGKVEIVNSSQARSFEGFELLRFIEGRKRLLIASLGAVIGYLVTDQVFAALISAFIFEMLFAIGVYYYTAR